MPSPQARISLRHETFRCEFYFLWTRIIYPWISKPDEEPEALQQEKMFAKADQLIEELKGESKAARVLQLWMGETSADAAGAAKSLARARTFKADGARALRGARSVGAAQASSSCSRACSRSRP